MTSKELKESYMRTSNNYKSDVPVMQLVEEYITESYEDKNRCIAEIIVRCWHIFDSLIYKKNPYDMISIDEAHNLFIDSLKYVLEKRVWKNKDNKLYQDENAILKALTVVVESRRKNYLIAIHRDKRKLHTTAISMDYLDDNFQEGQFCYVDDDFDLTDSAVGKIVIKKFKSKQYFSGFLLDSILNYDVFSVDGNLDKRKCRKYLKNLSENSVKRLESRYGLNLDSAYTYLKKYVNMDIDHHLTNALGQLYRDEELRNVVFN